MRYPLLTIFVFLLAALHTTLAEPATQKPDAASSSKGGVKRVLFIGNSYTMFNKLPTIFQEIVTGTGAATEVQQAAVGGMTLLTHLTRPETLNLVDAGRWDVVVLQGDSSGAAHPDISDNADFIKGAVGLYDRIKTKSPKAVIVLLETWAYHADRWKGTNLDKKDVGNNPTEMQANIRKGYQHAATQRKGFLVAPAGDAWELNYRSPVPVRLHREDNTHPLYHGSYLAALVIYATVYQPTDFNLSFGPSGEKAYLQNLASEAMKLQTRPE
ncbi:hypothetical protein BH11VER1_BH11VER1_38410 [soil metagenome]